MLIHRDDHLCRTKKKTSEAVLAQDTSHNTEELSKSITYKSNAAQNFLSNVTKDVVNKNDITNIIGSIQKSINHNSELMLMTDDEKIHYKNK